VELFEQIRRDYEFGGATISGVAKKYGVHRRMVRQALNDARPPERKQPERQRPVLSAVVPFINGILATDQRMPRKQRHTARRIWKRIRAEMPESTISESTIRQYVRSKKKQMGITGLTTCVPQCYSPGREGQVDWYESWAELGGVVVKLQAFTMRSMHSGSAFHRAYFRPTQQAFFEAHELAFAYFGGVFQTLRYDNLKAAVKKILRGYRREETERFIAFRSHWRFASEFCNPGEGHEKGGVEGEVCYFRRNHWVPLPKAVDLEDLNQQLMKGCREDEHRQIAGHPEPVGIAMIQERDWLLAPAERGFDLSDVCFPQVDGMGCVRVRTNLYSVPAKPGTTVEVRIRPSHIEVREEGRVIARHERCYEHQRQILELEHYLDVLERKPGALVGSKPLVVWREKGLWPESYDYLLAEMISRHGKSSGTRQMIQVVGLAKQYGHVRLQESVACALSTGCSDAAAIRHLVCANELARQQPEGIALKAELARFERPLPLMSEYDQLLNTGGAQ
jgi:transposase